ncbi:MAG: sigma-54 dependent transcriptional regulator [Candidatus Alcyoniella australis]|nr:sigma-54 dependent transcriptional regulator [Candidatus Alcyoniella australis]
MTKPGARFSLVTNSHPMRELLKLAQRVAPMETTVLIQGASGTGKERLARWIHTNSPRAKGPFVVLSCSAIPETLIESEMFGVTRGAFTGAECDRPGVMAEAHGGTLLLDEIADVAESVQVKLLRVIQERSVRAVGSDHEHPVDFRLLAATAQPLDELVEQGNFRRDLFYRLNVVTLTVPQLRLRREDLSVLADQILRQIAQDSSKDPKHLSDEALERLLEHDWPGNVRELENALERAVVLTRDELITPDSLALDAALHDDSMHPELPPGLSLAELERKYIAQVLAECGGNRSEAARQLGIDRKTLYRKLGRIV